MRWFLVAVCLGGCAGSPSQRPRSEPPTEQAASATATSAPQAREPVPSGTVELAVEGFEPAIAVLPETPDPVPLVIATHGAGGNAEWQCAHWAEIVKGRAIVLCPRGRRMSARYPGSYYYPDHIQLEREFSAMLAAARQGFGSRILEGAGIYTGFSQGATMGALMIIEHGRDFPYLILIEGGSAEFSSARARKYRETGGKSVYYVCGGGWCADRARKMASLLTRAGIEARAEHVAGGGHTDDGRVGERAAALFEELLQKSLAQGRR